MRIILIVGLSLGVLLAAYLLMRTPASPPGSDDPARSAAEAGALTRPSAGLSTSAAAADRVGEGGSATPVDPAPPSGPERAFLDSIRALDRAGLELHRGKLREMIRERQTELQASGSPLAVRKATAARGTDVLDVGRREAVRDRLVLAVHERFDKEAGQDVFDIREYEEGDDPEWARMDLELTWLERHLASLPE